MKKLLDVLEKIEAVGSSIEKEQYLREHLKEHPEDVLFFKLAFSDVVLGVGEKTFWNAFGVPQTTINEWEHPSDYLHHRNKTMGHEIIPVLQLKNIFKELEMQSGHAQENYINEIFHNMAPLYAKWYCRAICKSLRCGMNVKTVNKVLKGLKMSIIEKFSLQLCDKLDPLDENDIKKKLKFPVIGEIKYDGTRIQAEVIDGVCKLTSRRGKNKTDQFPEIVEELEKMFPHEHVILDGEIIAGSFQELSTRMHRLAENKNKLSTLKYMVFDLLLDESLPFVNRRSNLENLFASIDESPIIQLSQFAYLNNQGDLANFYSHANEKKEEGIIVKLLNSAYVRNSRKHWFKCKKVYTAEMRLTGYLLGEGKRAGKVSALRLEDKSGKFKCDVGSGISDEWCDYFTKEMQNGPIPDSIVEIAYNELTETGSVRFPRFITIRADKHEADDLTKVGLRQ